MGETVSERPLNQERRKERMLEAQRLRGTETKRQKAKMLADRQREAKTW